MAEENHRNHSRFKGWHKKIAPIEFKEQNDTEKIILIKEKVNEIIDKINP